MSAPALDPALHAPARLQIAAMLARVSEVEFSKIRAIVEVSDSVLSKHLAALVDAGYAELRKAPVDGRQRTWAALTKPGKRAFDAHMRSLRAMADAAAQAAAESAD